MGAVRILGIDPGLNRTGWGIVESEGNRLRHIAHGVVGSDPDDALSVRLSSIYSELAKIIVTWTPDEAAVEEVFVNKNPGSTLKLGMARGVCLLAPAMNGLKVAEYAANLVKKSVVGAGHADKTQVAMMVGVLLPGVRAKADAADALAVAICHAHHRNAPGAKYAPSPQPSPQRGEGVLSAALTTPRPSGEGGFRPKPEPIQIARARSLRTNSTDVEAKLWHAIRNDQLGTKFRRQSPILGYIADFLSNDAKLIVELDGGQHADNAADLRRTKRLEQAGFRVLRFWNNEVNESFDGVLQTIAAAIGDSAGNTLAPTGRGRDPREREGEGASLPTTNAAEAIAGFASAPSPGTLARSDLSPLGRGEIK
jgi:crossover junction endodeoxyribonuclease RuvC